MSVDPRARMRVRVCVGEDHLTLMSTCASDETLMRPSHALLSPVLQWRPVAVVDECSGSCPDCPGLGALQHSRAPPRSLTYHVGRRYMRHPRASNWIILQPHDGTSNQREARKPDCASFTGAHTCPSIAAVSKPNIHSLTIGGHESVACSFTCTGPGHATDKHNDERKKL